MASKLLGQAIIANAHPLECLGLSTLLRKVFYCDIVDNFDKLVELIVFAPLIALVDAELPGLGSLEQIRILHHKFPSTKLVVLLTQHTSASVATLIAAGVHGVISKPNVSSTQLVKALRMVAGGFVYVPPEICGSGVVSLRRESEVLSLSRRQLEVLRLASAGESNKEIARHLSISEGTVKVHIGAAFRAMGVHNRMAAVAVLKQLDCETITEFHNLNRLADRSDAPSGKMAFELM